MEGWIFGPTCDTLSKSLAGSASKHQIKALAICCLTNVTIDMEFNVLESREGLKLQRKRLQRIKSKSAACNNENSARVCCQTSPT